MFDRPFPTARAAGGRDDSVEQDTVVLPDEDENPASTTRRGDNENDHRDANGHYQRQRQPDDHASAKELGKHATAGTFGTAQFSRVLFKDDGDGDMSPVKACALQAAAHEQEASAAKASAQQAPPSAAPRAHDPWYGGCNGSSPLTSPAGALLEASPRLAYGRHAARGAAAPDSPRDPAAGASEMDEIELELAPLQGKVEANIELYQSAVELQNCSASLIGGMRPEVEQVILAYNKLQETHAEMVFQRGKRQRCEAVAKEALDKIQTIAAERFGRGARLEQSPATHDKNKNEEDEREARFARAQTQQL